MVPTKSHWKGGGAAAAESKGGDHGRQGRTSVQARMRKGQARLQACLGVSLRMPKEHLLLCWSPELGGCGTVLTNLRLLGQV